MVELDQRRIDNQRSEYVSARKAAQLLEVKPQTLYAYVSRGLLRSIAAPRGRARRYSLDDVRRLKTRRDARRGHVAVAASALDRGAPVLDSAITRIDERGPHYRGQAALSLARTGARFEDVAELLWASPESSRRELLPGNALLDALARTARVLPRGARPLQALTVLLPLASACDPDGSLASVPAELARGRSLLRVMACALGLAGSREPMTPDSEMRIAELAASALGLRPSADKLRAIDQMLVLSADHELNVSAFAVRVTASAGSSLYGCVWAGLAALQGTRHGGMCDRVEAMLRACPKPALAREAVRERARLGEDVPGFDQPSYPDGDPRGAFLLERALELGLGRRDVLVARAFVGAMRQARNPGPNLDFGLVSLCHALGLPPGSATALFALGRTAGFIAHALEQREHPVPLRPRARYIGV